MTKPPQTLAAAKRKIERLEAIIEALRAQMMQNAQADYTVIRRNADMAVCIAQARRILNGEDE